MENNTSNLNKQIKTLLEVTRALGTTIDLDSMLRMLVDSSMSLLQAERATIYLYDSPTQELYTRVIAGAEQFRMSIEMGIAGAAARSLEIINVPDAYADDRFNRTVDMQTGFRTRNILACPMKDFEGQLVGILQVLNKSTGPFDDNDIALAEAFSAQAGVAIQRAHLLEQYLEKQRLDDAMRIASEIQKGLLPQSAPPMAGYEIACWSRPSDAIGGDYCDFLSLSEHQLMVSLGDVCGHGVGPALVSCATRAMLRALGDSHTDVEQVMARVNRLTTGDLPDNRFVTAFLGVLDGENHKINYCSAGQGPLLWLRAADDEVEIRAAGGIPVGIIEDFAAWPEQTIDLEPGDIFAVMTDGFFEWARSDGEMFGIDRVVDILRCYRDIPTESMLKALCAAVEDFADTSQADDLTAIIIKRLPM